MAPDPTIPISYDYLVELDEDGKQADGGEPEVIIMPPLPDGNPSSSLPPSPPKQEPQS
jgi:hypothetical protein